MKISIVNTAEDESYGDFDILIDDKKLATALVEFYENGPQIKHVAARWGVPLTPIIKELANYLYENHGEPHGIFARIHEGETDMKQAYEEVGFVFFKDTGTRLLYHLKR
jgi:hypothetical protein